MSLISTRRLSRRYGRRVGIQDVDLQVDAGEIFGYLGPNGAGKSTTIRLLLGLLRPTSGSATIAGRDCWSESAEVKRELGYLPGDLRLYPSLTGSDALRMAARIRGLDLGPPGRSLAERFQLDLSVRVRQMSRGMRQKLGLILTLAHKPKVLVLDEPTSALDPLMQQELADCLRERAGDGDVVFFSSHTLSEVESLCDRVAIVREGRIVADEQLSTLRARARRTVVVSYAPSRDGEPALPEGLQPVQRDQGQHVYQWDGPAAALIRWAADQAIEDISISPPDLDSLFRRYYQREPAS